MFLLFWQQLFKENACLWNEASQNQN